MTPLTSCIMASVGLAIAGYPLLQLTMPSEAPITSQVKDERKITQAEDNLIPVYASIRYTGEPTSIKLNCAGRMLLDTQEIPAHSKSFSFSIPADTGMMEILIEVQWPEKAGSNTQQAVTLTLEPSQKPSQSQSCWTQGQQLHDLLLFVW